MIRSSRWQALIAVGAVAASVTVDAQQSPARCRTDCTIEKESMVTLTGVQALARDANPGTRPATTIGAWVVRDSRGRYAAISGDFRQLLIFDAAGKLLDSPRPTYGRIVSLFVDPMGAVQAFDSESGSLLTFGANYQVKTKTELPHRPALPLRGDRFLVASQIPTPTLAGQPLHVMSKDGNIVRSFGADGSPFRSTETLKNWRAVCLNPDGTVWSIAAGGRLLERWDTATGRRLSQVTVKSTWFRESSRAAPTDQVANPIILTIWAEGRSRLDLVSGAGSELDSAEAARTGVCRERRKRRPSFRLGLRGRSDRYGKRCRHEEFRPHTAATGGLECHRE